MCVSLTSLICDEREMLRFCRQASLSSRSGPMASWSGTEAPRLGDGPRDTVLVCPFRKVLATSLAKVSWVYANIRLLLVLLLLREVVLEIFGRNHAGGCCIELPAGKQTVHYQRVNYLRLLLS